MPISTSIFAGTPYACLRLLTPPVTDRLTDGNLIKGPYSLGPYPFTDKFDMGPPFPPNPVPLHENLGDDHRDNRGEVDREYRDNQGGLSRDQREAGVAGFRAALGGVFP